MPSLNDLNFCPTVLCNCLSRSTSKESAFEPRTNRVCSTHQLLVSQRIQPVRRALRWQQECAHFLLLGPVADNVIRPTDLSREPSRYRSVSGRTTEQALSLRTQRTSEALLACRCQRTSGLENLRRFRSHAHRHCSPALRRHRAGLGPYRNGLTRSTPRLSICVFRCSLGQDSERPRVLSSFTQ